MSTTIQQIVRPRRLRRTQTLRDLVQEHHVRVEDLIYPVFIEEEIVDPVPISSMPGIYRYPENMIPAVLQEIEECGVKAVLLFGVSHHKDAIGADSLKENGLLSRMIKSAKEAAPELCVIADNCFCEYTDHGHCGVVKEGDLANDESLENLAKQAVICAKAGADMVAPSAMLDGQIAAMREGLDAAGFSHIPIMAYAAKFASCFYGPFRVAAGCGLLGHRKSYQMNPANGREAMREILLDEAEGADVIMVKPGLPYLDVLAKAKEMVNVPLAAYQVSGEYAMIEFAAEAEAIDRDRAIMESLTAFKRAGADLIITYHALKAAELLQAKS